MNIKTDDYFLDTEFDDPDAAGFSINFISLGLVGKQSDFYGVYDGVDDTQYKGRWIYDNVIVKLPPPSERLSLERIRAGVLETFAPAKAIDIWAHNGSYDFYILARLFGGQLALKHALHDRFGIEKISFRDTKEEMRHLPADFKFPAQDEATEHIAIDDARHERDVFYAAQRYRVKALPITAPVLETR